MNDADALSNVFATPANDGPPAPRIVYDMPESEYHARKEDSASGIEKFIRDRGEYREWRAGTLRDKPTAEMLGGRYYHAGFLEPNALDRFAVAPKLGDKRKNPDKKTFDEWKASVGKRTRIDDHAAADCLAAMLAAVASHPEAGPLMFPVDDGQNEVAMVWTDEETGRPMRAKLDRWLPDRLLTPELKTTDHALNMRQQQALWWRLGYHRKAAIYLDGLLAITGKTHAMPFVFVTVHPTRPRVWVRWAQIDDPAVMIGRREYRQALVDIAACEASGEWREPFELEVGRALELPAWAVNEAIGGMAITGVEGA